MMSNRVLLGVNVDHVATIRQARGTAYPDPVQAALLAEKAGADGITMHLREDRRHIQDHDIERAMQCLTTRLNFEMAVTEEMIAIALKYRPAHCCFVPEKREELTTEGGLDVVGQGSRIQDACARLMAAGIAVSLFIDPDEAQIDASKAVGASTIELHTGDYAQQQGEVQQQSLQRISHCVQYALDCDLIVNAGHGLHYDNTQAIARVPGIYELNIGHAIVAEALFSGLSLAVQRMKALLL
jgi:pyridoxine 5-phosphate synthase